VDNVVKKRSVEDERVERYSERGICSMCSRREVWNRILGREGTRIWEDDILNYRYKDIDV
jgi:hypothetical protein